MTDRYARIREALEMEPTPGPFSASRSYSPGNQELILSLTYKDEYGFTEDYCTVRNRLGDTWKTEANAAHIAACDPDTIRELLAERDALAAENERLRAERVWQPIETAPKDGTKVDLWVVDPLGEGRRVPDCSWGWGQWIGSKGLAAERLGHKATHWIYLPTPPQEASDERA